MSRETGTLTFDEWVEYVFNRPVTTPEWYWQQNEAGDDLNWWQPEPVTLATYLARLFEEGGLLAGKYTAAQLDQGFWFIAGGGSNYLLAAKGTVVPIDLQERWLRAILPLYRDLFAVLCSDHLGHLNEGPANPLNSACYMFWDMFSDLFLGIDCPEWAAMFPGCEHLVDPIFEVLRDILALDSIACKESALHGLRHLERYHPDYVHEIIDGFLERSPVIRPQLRTYAQAARAGHVL